MLNLLREYVKSPFQDLNYRLADPILQEVFGTSLASFPYLIRTPDIFLLRFLDNTSFVMLHILLILALSFCGVYFLLGNYTTNLSSEIFFVFTWYLNGALISRFSVGHVQLLGYLFIPIFCLFFLPRTTQRNGFKLTSWHLSTFLYFILLLGSTHTFFQMTLLTIILFILIPSIRNQYRGTLSKLGILSSWIAVPSLFFSIYTDSYEEKSRSVYGGYGWGYRTDLFGTYDVHSIISLIQSLLIHSFQIVFHVVVALVDPDTVFQQEGWEWSIYSGPCILLIGVMAIYLARKNHIQKTGKSRGIELRIFFKKYSAVLVMTIISAVLSVSKVYGSLYALLSTHIPFLPAVDRIPFRMLLYPLATFLLFCLTLLPNSKSQGAIFNYLMNISILVNIGFLLSNLVLWSSQGVASLSNGSPNKISSYQFIRIDNFIDSQTIVLGFLSFTSFCFSLVALRKIWALRNQ